MPTETPVIPVVEEAVIDAIATAVAPVIVDSGAGEADLLIEPVDASLALDTTQQQRVGRVIAEARKDSRERAHRYWMHELGVASVQEARDRLATAHAQLAAHEDRIRAIQADVETGRTMTEGNLEQARQQTLLAVAERDIMRSTAERAVLDAAIRVAAIRANLVDPEDAVRFLDTTKFVVNLDNRSVEGVEDAMTRLLTARPYLVQASDVVAPPPVVPPSPDGSRNEQMHAEVRQAARDGVAGNVRSWF